MVVFVGVGILVGVWLAGLPETAMSGVVQKAWTLGPMIAGLIAHVAHVRGKLEGLSKQEGINAREQDRLGYRVGHKLTIFNRILTFYVALSLILILMALVPDAFSTFPFVTLPVLGGAVGLCLYLFLMTLAEIRAVHDFTWMLDQRKIAAEGRKRALGLFKDDRNGVGG